MQKKEQTVPALRFPEFTEGWQTKKIKDLSKENLQNGVFNDPSKVGSGYRLINVKDMYSEGAINEKKLLKLELSEKDFLNNKVKNGDTFFTRSSLVKEGIAHSNVYIGDADDVTFDGHLIRLRPDLDEVSPIFLNSLLKTHRVRKELVAYGKTATMTTIGQGDVASCIVIFPFKPEQQKIAAFLGAVDDKIAQLQKKKDLLESYKKGCMQKLFSQEIRFKDDNGNPFPDWEEKKLGDFCKVFSGGTPTSAKREYYNGEIPFIGSGDIGDKNIMQHITEDALNNSSAKLVNKGDLLYALYGATSGQVAISKIQGAINQAVLCIRTKEITVFLYQYLTYKQDRILSTYLQGGQGNLSGDIVKKLTIDLPCADEQKEIADFLAGLDDKIALVADGVDKAKLFKKGLLQQMFV